MGATGENGTNGSEASTTNSVKQAVEHRSTDQLGPVHGGFAGKRRDASASRRRQQDGSTNPLQKASPLPAFQFHQNWKRTPNCAAKAELPGEISSRTP
jgi:hypothetical protein